MATMDVPENEVARLQALRRLDLLNTLPEQNYDDIAQLAAFICGTPIAAVNFIDHERQWTKARRPRRGRVCKGRITGVRLNH